MILTPHIFREYDIRGEVFKDYDLEFAQSLGKAFGDFISENLGPNKKISIGYDARISSPELEEACLKGLRTTGHTLYRLGLVSSPMCYASVFLGPKVDAGFMITGSHNPPKDNGFKFVLGGDSLHGPQIQRLKELILNNDLNINSSPVLSEVKHYNLLKDYVDRFESEFKFNGETVVFDCANGTAGISLRSVCEAINLNPIILFEEPDGNFPNHHPDPTIEANLVDLKKSVLEHNALAGFGFDGDSDRLGVVTDKAESLYADNVLMFVTPSILKEYPGAPIVGDVKCSDFYFQCIENHGGKPIMWKTGHSLIKKKVKELKAPLGGELSGHIFFNDRFYGFDDALYAALRVLEEIVNNKVSLSEFKSQLPLSFQSPEIRVLVTEESKMSLVQTVKEAAKKDPLVLNVNEQDGARIGFKDGWALIRSSNTQPAITLRFEASSEKSLQEIKNWLGSKLPEEATKTWLT